MNSSCKNLLFFFYFYFYQKYGLENKIFSIAAAQAVVNPTVLLASVTGQSWDLIKILRLFIDFILLCLLCCLSPLLQCQLVASNYFNWRNPNRPAESMSVLPAALLQLHPPSLRPLALRGHISRGGGGGNNT